MSFDLSRRRAIRTLGVGLLTPYLITFHRQGSARMVDAPAGPRRDGGRDVFSLSIMSGDPSATGVVLWTRIDPVWYQAGTTLRFQVSDEQSFNSLVLEGEIPASAIGPASDYTARVDLDGQLQSARRYYYRFIYRDVASPIGRCRTAPASGMSVNRLSLALLSCQDYANGYYGAFRHLAQRDDVDFVLHLGDLIYEYATDPHAQSLPFADRQILLPSGGSVALSLDDYRHLYRTYRRDPDLQACLEQHTFIVIWDDHETANDCYWDYDRDTLGAPDHPYTLDATYGNDPSLLRQLKRDAQQAWLEYVPARVEVNHNASHPWEHLSIYRRIRLGDLADLFLTDERSYRSPHPCGEGNLFERLLPVGCQDYRASDQTMLGHKQRDWLIDGMTSSSAQWKLWGNQVCFMELALPRDGRRIPLNVDAWDGFMAERRYLSDAFWQTGVENLCILTGDFHSYAAGYIKRNYQANSNLDRQNVIGTEFLTTSITSANVLDGLAGALDRDPATPDKNVPIGNRLFGVNNPHLEFFDSAQHGYSVLDLATNACEWSAYAVDKNSRVEDPQARLFRRFRRESGSMRLIDNRLAVWV